jgi:hypothetical protein
MIMVPNPINEYSRQDFDQACLGEKYRLAKKDECSMNRFL